MDWSSLLNWNEYTKLLIALLALADPFGNLPVVASLTQSCSVQIKRQIINLSAVTFIIALFLFTFFGAFILGLFGITLPALKIAGGILFLFYALELLGMIRLPASKDETSKNSNALGIVPVGIPILAGPGTISKVIISAEQDPSIEHKLLVCAVIITVALITLVLFRAVLVAGAKLGDASTTIISKIIGLLLAGIAVEFILEGIVAFFPGIVSIL